MNIFSCGYLWQEIRNGYCETGKFLEKKTQTEKLLELQLRMQEFCSPLSTSSCQRDSCKFIQLPAQNLLFFWELKFLGTHFRGSIIAWLDTFPPHYKAMLSKTLYSVLTSTILSATMYRTLHDLSYKINISRSIITIHKAPFKT